VEIVTVAVDRGSRHLLARLPRAILPDGRRLALTHRMGSTRLAGAGGAPDGNAVWDMSARRLPIRHQASVDCMAMEEVNKWAWDVAEMTD